MDTWYATKEIMCLIEQRQKYYYCPLKKNRLVDDSQGVKKYQQVSSVTFHDQEQTHGKLIKINGFPKEHRVKLFRVAWSSTRTDYVVTNDITQSDLGAVQQVCRYRWKIEEFHRELKQLTGIEGCQCRKARMVRNHIGCAMLVWIHLKRVAIQTGRTIYQVKRGLLSDYLRQQMKSPNIKMAFA